MSKYLAVLGRQPEISLAELEILLGVSVTWTGDGPEVAQASATWTGDVAWGPPAESSGASDVGENATAGPVQSLVYAKFTTDKAIDINRLGGTQKLAVRLDQPPLSYLTTLPAGKLTIGVSDYSKQATKKSATTEALKLKKILVRHGRSVRVVENKGATLSNATSLHNGLSGKNERKVELIKTDDGWYRVVGVQDIDAYTKRDQARPARDAKVGMLPPKLAQILINLCGDLPKGATILDPFCGTGVVLQEALLMGYQASGTDINERMVEYTERNLKWLLESEKYSFRGNFQVSQGNAMTFQWQQPIDAVACEGYLGQPMSCVPSEIKLKEQKQECKATILGFLKNLAEQIKPGTSVVIAAPSWLRNNGEYSRLNILDDIKNMGYNVNNRSHEGLIYRRVGQIVARDIIILRKK